MNFTFGGLMASMLVSGIGFVLFKYGRRMGRSIFVTIGLILLIFPYFVGDLSWLIGVTLGLCALLYGLLKLGY